MHVLFTCLIPPGSFLPYYMSYVGQKSSTLMRPSFTINLYAWGRLPPTQCSFIITICQNKWCYTRVLLPVSSNLGYRLYGNVPVYKLSPVFPPTLDSTVYRLQTCFSFNQSVSRPITCMIQLLGIILTCPCVFSVYFLCANCPAGNLASRKRLIDVLIPMTSNSRLWMIKNESFFNVFSKTSNNTSRFFLGNSQFSDTRYFSMFRESTLLAWCFLEGKKRNYWKEL